LRRSTVIVLVVVAGATACGGNGPKSTASTTTTTESKFNALADTYVRQNEPNRNFGKNRALIVDGVPVAQAFLRFETFGLTGQIVRATLRLYSLTANGDGFQLRVAGPRWNEATTTYANAPPIGRLVALSGALDPNAWRSLDVTSIVKAHPPRLDFALTGTGASQLMVASRESETPPQLVVETRRS
jgi:hypothetical protein